MKGSVKKDKKTGK